MPKLNWNGNDFRNSQDSSGTVADNISRNGNLQQGYDHGSLTGGLVAYYPMEKGQGEVLHDGVFDNIGQIKPGSSGENTKTSDMWTTGKVGNNSLNFDGTDDYVDFGSPSPLNFISQSDATLSAWFKTTENGKGRIVSWGAWSWAGGAALIFNHENEGEVNFHVGITSGDQSDGILTRTQRKDFNDGEWHHVTAVFKWDDYVRVYVDGIQQNIEIRDTNCGSSEGDEIDITGCTKMTFDAPDSDNLYVGRGRGGQYADGQIDDVRVYDRALSEPEIKALHNEGNGVQSGVQKKEKNVPSQNEGGISRYKLNGTTEDDWGNNPGTNYGADLTATGVYGQAAQFDSSNNDYITIGNPYSAGNYSISSWVDVRDLSSNRVIIQAKDAGGEASEWRVQLSAQSNEVYQLIQKNSGNNAISVKGGSLNTNSSWRFLVGAWDGSALYLYLNGTLIDSISCSSIYSTPDEWSIGYANHSDNQYFDGRIDDVRIYKNALTPLQVEKLYHKGAYRISRESTLQ